MHMPPTVKLKNSEPTENDRLYEIFHENTKHRWSRNLETSDKIGRYLSQASSIQETASNYKRYRLAATLALPKPQPLDMSVSTALERRVSVRKFAELSLTVQQLSNLLFHGAACTRSATSDIVSGLDLRFRSYPSGGGLYPVEIYPVLLRIDGRPAAVTHYDPLHHRLSILNESLALEQLALAFVSVDALLQTCSVLVFMTAVFERSTVKYGDRGYRLSLLEAGHLAQNLCLTAAAQGLGSLTHAGYDDDVAARWLGVDGLNEAIIHSLFVGHPAAQDEWTAYLSDKESA
jgi:SagB-type dehydrogenase family enzyme